MSAIRLDPYKTWLFAVVALWALSAGCAMPARANPPDLLLVNGNIIRQSIDGGRSWKIVVRGTTPDTAQPLDLGFTSNSQGFAIFDDGGMLMTYDSGATWSQVTLP